MKFKTKAALLAATAIGAGVLVSTSALPAQAAIGDEIIQNGDFEDITSDGSLVGGATTAFNLAQLGVQGFEYADSGELLTSWDEGTYVVGTNPLAQHILWYDDPSDQMMIVNGFTDNDSQVVWEQSNPGIVCEAGDQVTYDFSAVVANILPQEAYDNGGAAITVVINGEEIDTIDLTDNDGTEVPLEGSAVPALSTVTLQILNASTVKIGNDFSLDDISLIQTSGCLNPVPVAFDVPTTLPTCEAGAQFNELFPADRDGYTLTVDRPYDGPGEYTITATADEGNAFEGEGDPFVRSVTVTLDGPLSAELEECAPDIGGKTIGYWTNKNGTVVGAPLWPTVVTTYPNLVGTQTTFGAAQTFIKKATSSGTGVTMLQAQFYATALNTLAIGGYGAQHITVPESSVIDGGETVTVYEYLAHIEAAFGTTALDEKAEYVSVQSVLNLINQDIASDLFV